MDAREARALVDAWRSTGEAFSKVGNYITVWRDQTWRVLGYDSFEAFCTTELAGLRIALPIGTRQQIVRQLTHEGMTKREISAALGVGERTVARNRVPPGTTRHRKAPQTQASKSASVPHGTPAADVLAAEMAATEQRDQDQRGEQAWAAASLAAYQAAKKLRAAIDEDPQLARARATWARRSPEVADKYVALLEQRLDDVISTADELKKSLSTGRKLRRVQ